MANRNRVIYQSEGLFASLSPATGSHFTSTGFLNTGVTTIRELKRVQSVTTAFNIARTDVNQFGELSRIDAVILSAPTVNLGFDYLSNSFVNEKILGFTISSGSPISCISGILNKTQDERNYFIETVGEGVDNVNLAVTAPAVVAALGNGFISSYGFSAAVGSFPKVSVAVEALNYVINSSTGENIPAVNPSDGTSFTGLTYVLPVSTTNASGDLGISVLRPGDLNFSFGTYNAMGALVSDAKIQSCNISVALSREPLEKLGSKYAFSREIKFPLTISLSATALVGDLATGNLVNFVSADLSYNLSINVKQPGTNLTAIQYDLLGSKLDSQSFSNSIGSNKTVTWNFSTQIGGPGVTGIGMIMSGIN